MVDGGHENITEGGGDETGSWGAQVWFYLKSWERLYFWFVAER